MDGNSFETHFARIGARVRVLSVARGTMTLDVGRDGRGAFFDVRVRDGVEARVVDVDEGLRHALVLGVNVDPIAPKRRFLCGHDEREWFVAAVPGESVSSVRQAMEALKPLEVRLEQERRGVSAADRVRRRTAAYVRQGEWFFLPRPRLTIDERLVLRDEPLSRGSGSKPHLVDLMYREGGESVMVCSHRPNGVSMEAYRNLIRTRPSAAAWNWHAARVSPTAYVKGRVRHPDHATVKLDVWHQVAMNTEGAAPGVRNVRFLD